MITFSGLTLRTLSNFKVKSTLLMNSNVKFLTSLTIYRELLTDSLNRLTNVFKNLVVILTDDFSIKNFGLYTFEKTRLVSSSPEISSSFLRNIVKDQGQIRCEEAYVTVINEKMLIPQETGDRRVVGRLSPNTSGSI